MQAGQGLPTGSIFAGDYRIIRPLSAGGMGAVYVAEQISTARERALKIMLGELTGRDDVWSLGLIAFHCLTGKRYWMSANDANTSAMMVMREVAMDPIASASHRARQLAGAPLPAGFDAWFGQCVVRDPAARFRNAGELQVALRLVLQSSSSGTVAAPNQKSSVLPWLQKLCESVKLTGAPP